MNKKRLVIIIAAAVIALTLVIGVGMMVAGNSKYSRNFFNLRGFNFDMTVGELIDYERLYYGNAYDGMYEISENWIRHSFDDMAHLYFFSDDQIQTVTYRNLSQYDIPFDPLELYGEPDEVYPELNVYYWYGKVDGVRMELRLWVDYKNRYEMIELIRCD